jgi:hypothetical protein
MRELCKARRHFSGAASRETYCASANPRVQRQVASRIMKALVVMTVGATTPPEKNCGSEPRVDSYVQVDAANSSTNCRKTLQFAVL